MIRLLIDNLISGGHLTSSQYRQLLVTNDQKAIEYLYKSARNCSKQVFGNRIYLRGLIEISNVCHNNCYYCGIRCGNGSITRYTLSQQEILSACEQGYNKGFRTFVLQGGEWDEAYSQRIGNLISEIHSSWHDCAITLSLGEHSRLTYQLWKNAGADRYLLRHETANEKHYQLLHPTSMSQSHRINCLKNLKSIGYQIGTGMMVGAPFQTINHLVEDIQLITMLKPHMIGLGPFVPQQDSPFSRFPAGSIDLTTRLYAIFRLLFPLALIPSTTALSTLASNGRQLGINAGANVLMPNITPLTHRTDYALYNNKSVFGAESVEGLKQLEQELLSIGYTIDWSRGDSPQA